MKVTKYILPIFVVSIVILTGCIDNFQISTFDHDGVTRQYILYLPDNLPENAPLVFVLHGYIFNAPGIMASTGMNHVADKNGFAVCYPQGTLDEGGKTHWNARFNISKTDDIGFLTELAQYLQSEYNLNPQRTYICGHSNGGFMSYTLACEAPDVFNAIASVAGTMSGYTWNNRNISEPIPILQIHGLDDKIIPINGSLNSSGGWGGAPHMDTIIEFWVNLNNCSTSEYVSISSNTNAYYYTDGIGGNEVWYYKIANWGHGWPIYNSEKPDYNPGINASEVIWEFFEAHPKQ